MRRGGAPGRLRERTPAQEQGEEREAGPDEERERELPVSQNAADPRANGESEPHRRSHHTHGPAAVLFARRVGDVGHRGGQGSRAQDSSEDPGQEQLPDLVRETEHGERHGVAEQSQGENRLPADPVARGSPQGGKEKLHARVAGGQQADLEWGRAHVPRVELQHGEDDPEAHHGDEDGQEEDHEAAPADVRHHDLLCETDSIIRAGCRDCQGAPCLTGSSGLPTINLEGRSSVAQR